MVFFIYAQTHLGLSAAQSGLVTLPYAIVAVAMIRLGEKATLRFWWQIDAHHWSVVPLSSASLLLA